MRFSRGAKQGLLAATYEVPTKLLAFIRSFVSSFVSIKVSFPSLPFYDTRGGRFSHCGVDGFGWI